MLAPMLLASGNTPIVRCASEYYPVGTGIPGVSDSDEKADRNLIVAVSKVTYRTRNAQSIILGYVIKTASGSHYYEFGSGLNTRQQDIEIAFLKRAGVSSQVQSHLREFARNQSRAFFEYAIPEAAFTGGVSLEPCAPKKGR